MSAHPLWDTRNEIDRLRGRFMSDMNAAEEDLDLALTAYFTGRIDTEGFRSLLLRRIRTREKIDLAAEVADRLGVADSFRPYFREWRELNQRRNEMAHSYVAIDESAWVDALYENDEEAIAAIMTDWRIVRITGAGQQSDAVTEAQLHLLVDRTDRLRYAAVRLILAAAFRDKSLPERRTALEEFDTANPGSVLST